MPPAPTPHLPSSHRFRAVMRRDTQPQATLASLLSKDQRDSTDPDQEPVTHQARQRDCRGDQYRRVARRARNGRLRRSRRSTALSQLVRAVPPGREPLVADSKVRLTCPDVFQRSSFVVVVFRHSTDFPRTCEPWIDPATPSSSLSTRLWNARWRSLWVLCPAPGYWRRSATSRRGVRPLSRRTSRLRCDWSA
jgi:hypothetical protein